MGAGLPGTACTALFVRGTGISTYELTAAAQGAYPVHRWNGAAFAELGTAPNPSPDFPISVAYFGGRYTVTSSNGTVRALATDGTWAPLTGPQA